MSNNRWFLTSYGGVKLGLTEVTLALLVPVDNEEVPSGLSRVETVEAVQVNVMAIGWT